MIGLIANLLVLALNIGVLCLTVKLYTEILKDASQNRRVRSTATPAEAEAREERT